MSAIDSRALWLASQACNAFVARLRSIFAANLYRFATASPHEFKQNKLYDRTDSEGRS